MNVSFINFCYPKSSVFLNLFHLYKIILINNWTNMIHIWRQHVFNALSYFRNLENQTFNRLQTTCIYMSVRFSEYIYSLMKETIKYFVFIWYQMRSLICTFPWRVYSRTPTPTICNRKFASGITAWCGRKKIVVRINYYSKM